MTIKEIEGYNKSFYASKEELALACNHLYYEGTSAINIDNNSTCICEKCNYLYLGDDLNRHEFLSLFFDVKNDSYRLMQRLKILRIASEDNKDIRNVNATEINEIISTITESLNKIYELAEKSYNKIFSLENKTDSYPNNFREQLLNLIKHGNKNVGDYNNTEEESAECQEEQDKKEIIESMKSVQKRIQENSVYGAAVPEIKTTDNPIADNKENESIIDKAFLGGKLNVSSCPYE